MISSISISWLLPGGIYGPTPTFGVWVLSTLSDSRASQDYNNIPLCWYRGTEQLRLGGYTSLTPRQCLGPGVQNLLALAFCLFPAAYPTDAIQRHASLSVLDLARTAQERPKSVLTAPDKRLTHCDCLIGAIMLVTVGMYHVCFSLLLLASIGELG